MRKIKFDKCIIGTGKAGIDFSAKLAQKYDLPTESKSVQLGVRFEAPQKYFQKLIDVSYDFKLYQKPNDKVSLRSFCTNNNAAYVAVEETYGDITYNGHAKKGEQFRNDMTNFGILMEIKGIEDPFEWSRDVVQKCQVKEIQSYNVQSFDLTNNGIASRGTGNIIQKGLYYSPKGTRKPSNTSENDNIKVIQIYHLEGFKEAFGEYADYIIKFIDQMNEVFEFGDDWGIYIPECKYLSPEPLVNYDNLSLTTYNNIHFAGDALSARGITVAGSHGIYIAESILSKN